jgi:sensor histidine kinase YesM
LFTLVITYSINTPGGFFQHKQVASIAEDNLALELNALKAQINPHFLFNTLNIYSLALRKSDLAPEMVLKLSDMMRYVRCNSGPVPVERKFSSSTIVGT